MDTANTSNGEVLGDPGATPENPGGLAGPPGADSVGDSLQSQSPEVTTVSLVQSALQAPEVAPQVLNKDGTPRRKPGRKPGQKNGEGAAAVTGAAPAKVSPAKTAAMVKAQQLTSEQTAKALINTTLGVLVETIGPEWDFDSPEEAASMKLAVAAYIDAKGGANLSPEAMLGLSLAGYGFPRLKHPNTREKIGGFFRSAFSALRAIFRR